MIENTRKKLGGGFTYPPCRFNPCGVVCNADKSRCYRCGWNPAVDAKRKAELRINGPKALSRKPVHMS